MQICAESPEEATEPTVHLYPNIDGDDTEDNSTIPSQMGPASQFSNKGKGKAHAYEDNLLSSLEMTPSKKTRMF